jgi:hypothetical protein
MLYRRLHRASRGAAVLESMTGTEGTEIKKETKGGLEAQSPGDHSYEVASKLRDAIAGGEMREGRLESARGGVILRLRNVHVLPLRITCVG